MFQVQVPVQPILVHATAIAIGGRAVLLRGPSGSGKSDLALRLIDGGAELIADDQVAIACEGDVLLCSASPRLAGLLEIRGFGPVKMTRWCERAPLAMVVDLKTREDLHCAETARIAETITTDILGRSMPALSLCAFDASAPARVRVLLDVIAAGQFAIAEADTDASLLPSARPVAA